MNPRATALRVLNQLDATSRHMRALRFFLDHILQPFCRRPLEALQPEVLHLLRLGAIELTRLSTPPHAVVSSAVDLAKAARRSAAAGLVNAVLRALARGWREVGVTALEADPAGFLSLTLSHPRWLVEELLATHAFDEVAAWLAAKPRLAPLALRANTLPPVPGLVGADQMQRQSGQPARHG